MDCQLNCNLIFYLAYELFNKLLKICHLHDRPPFRWMVVAQIYIQEYIYRNQHNPICIITGRMDGTGQCNYHISVEKVFRELFMYFRLKNIFTLFKFVFEIYEIFWHTK